MKNYKKGFVIPLVIAIIALLGIGGGAYVYVNNKSTEKIEINTKKINDAKEVKNSIILETEARVIAEKSCVKGGEVLNAGTYNPNSKTWWYDANLNATREGCNPACVVSEETKTAEINWRCTGFISQ